MPGPVLTCYYLASRYSSSLVASLRKKSTNDFGLSMRQEGVTISGADQWHAVKQVGVIGAYMTSRLPATLLLAGMLAVMVYRLLAERERRKTLVCLLERAPGGTIVVMKEGQGGPAMSLRVGDGSHPLPPRGPG